MFRLALALHRTVEELECTMSCREFIEWQAYYKVDPFGLERFDLIGGVICSLLANIHRDPRKTKPFKPSDFMPEWDREAKPRQTVEQQAEMLKMLSAAFGGELKTKDRKNA